MEIEHKILPNNEIIGELIKFLDEGQRVILPVKGNSMLPFIIGDRESVELVKPDHVAVGDVVLAWINGCRYVVHRIIRIENNQIQLMGDGNLSGDEYCLISDVKARADYVIGQNGKKHYLYTHRRVQASHLWWKLKPLRRYILAIYRRTWLKMI